jgi:hypothetical protein
MDDDIRRLEREILDQETWDRWAVARLRAGMALPKTTAWLDDREVHAEVWLTGPDDGVAVFELESPDGSPFLGIATAARRASGAWRTTTTVDEIIRARAGRFAREVALLQIQDRVGGMDAFVRSVMENPGILFPLVPRRVDDDGAAACARAVLMNVGVEVPQRRLDRYLSQDGGSLRMLARVIRRIARSSGVALRTIVYERMTTEDLSAHLNEMRPVAVRIAPRVGPVRWVVACSFDGTHVVVMDPGLEAFVPVDWRELRRSLRGGFRGVVVVRGSETANGT